MAINDIPLSWSDPLFSDNVNSGSVTIPKGGTLSNVSITQTGSIASVVLSGGATIDDVRISSREGVRLGGSGNVTISNAYIEATGQSGDHADSIQAYAPGSSGTVTITDTTIVAHSSNATAGMFVADYYTGTFNFDNVVFYGGPYGLRICNDGPGEDYVSLKDVYFVGPFNYGAVLFQEVNAPIHITQWENVRYATIENGVLVPGALIPPPWSVEGTTPVATPVTNSVSINNVTISEGDSGTKAATFTVTRSGGTAAFDVNFATSNGSATVADSDYVAVSNTLHFAAGQNTQTISVAINGDTKVEGSETFNVILSNATNGAIISDSQAVGTITNDDGASDVLVTGVILNGTSRNDTLRGGEGNDSITGLEGSDWLYGNGGNDTLVGGTDNDQLSGGAGADVFRFGQNDSKRNFGFRDLIWDYQPGTDKIDLSAVDAKTGTDGDQAFTLEGSGSFASGVATPGLLRWHFDAASDRTLIEGTTDTSPGIDVQISLVGQHSLTAADFVL